MEWSRESDRWPGDLGPSTGDAHHVGTWQLVELWSSGVEWGGPRQFRNITNSKKDASRTKFRFGTSSNLRKPIISPVWDLFYLKKTNLFLKRGWIMAVVCIRKALRPLAMAMAMAKKSKTTARRWRASVSSSSDRLYLCLKVNRMIASTTKDIDNIDDE